MPENKCIFMVAGIAAGIVGLLLVILLPMSFVTLEYHEFGFKRQKSTGSVDVTKVYSGGKYLLGPDAEFKVFKANAHYLNLNTRVFTADKLEVNVMFHVQYFLRKDELPLLHKQFDLYYENVMETSAVDAIKGAIPVYNTRQLIANRTQIEDVLFKAVSQRLGGTCCRPDCKAFKFACPDGCSKNYNECERGLNVDVKYFQLTEIVIPSDVEDRFMEALVLQEENLREELYQEAAVIRKETMQMVAKITNEAKELSENGQVLSENIATVSRANYTNIVEKARGVGLKLLFKELNITEQKHKNSFDYLRTLRGLDGIHLTVDFQQRIAGNL